MAQSAATEARFSETYARLRGILQPYAAKMYVSADTDSWRNFVRPIRSTLMDPGRRTLTFANAGHLRPLLAQDGEARFLDTERGMPLGIGFGDFSESEVVLSPGARLLFYSDGITEAEGPAEEEYGAARLQGHALQPGTSTESILENVRGFVNGAGLRDDATVIFVKAM